MIKIRRINMENRKFKCYECNYEWELPQGNGQMGINLKCPKCNGTNVHRIDSGRHGARMGFCRSSTLSRFILIK